MNLYQQVIVEAAASGKDVEYIEDVMRNDIFHSTLDWQSRAQLVRAAKEAAGLLAEYRDADYCPLLPKEL